MHGASHLDVYRMRCRKCRSRNCRSQNKQQGRAFWTLTRAQSTATLLEQHQAAACARHHGLTLATKAPYTSRNVFMYTAYYQNPRHQTVTQRLHSADLAPASPGPGAGVAHGGPHKGCTRQTWHLRHLGPAPGSPTEGHAKAAHGRPGTSVTWARRRGRPGRATHR